MRLLIVCLWTLTAPIVLAQELHTFSNGEVADADKINENFQYLLENATGSSGCSAQQDGSSVVITCADGTSGALASQGTVVFLEGLIGEVPDLSAVPTDFVLQDADGTILGAVFATQTSSNFSVYNLNGFSINSIGVLVDNAADTIVGIANVDDVSAYDYYPSIIKLYYTTEDCSGPAFSDTVLRGHSKVMLIESQNEFSPAGDVIAFPTTPQVSTLMKSWRAPGGITLSGKSMVGDCQVLDVPQIISGAPMQTWYPPEELLAPTFPLSVVPINP